MLTKASREADAVIHAAFSGDGSYTTGVALDSQAVDTFIEVLAGTDKKFIYTSGIGVYGDTGPEQANEATLPQPLPLMQWRPPLEQKVIEAAKQDRLAGIVLRPPIVYGRGGSGFIRMLIGIAQEQKTTFYIGTGENSGPTVHVEDLAQAYLRAIEVAPSGTVLNIIAAYHTMRELMEAISYAAGQEGRTKSLSIEQAGQLLGPMAGILAANLNVSGMASARLLNWQPRQIDILDDLKYGSYR